MGSRLKYKFGLGDARLEAWPVAEGVATVHRLAKLGGVQNQVWVRWDRRHGRIDLTFHTVKFSTFKIHGERVRNRSDFSYCEIFVSALLNFTVKFTVK